MCGAQSGGVWREALYSLVARIPSGSVATYGQLALLSGRPRAARIVGYAMARAPERLPSHRVINKSGSLAPRGVFEPHGLQRALLEAEGVPFLPDGRVDVQKCLWRPQILD